MGAAPHAPSQCCDPSRFDPNVRLVAATAPFLQKASPLGVLADQNIEFHYHGPQQRHRGRIPQLVATIRRVDPATRPLSVCPGQQP